MTQYLLDTDICIFFLKGKYNLREKVREVGAENCFVSEVTVGELLYGANYSQQLEKHLNEVDSIKKAFGILSISDCLELFGKEKAKLRREGQLTPDFDLLIGVTSVHHKMKMVTNNEKHLSRIEGIEIENWFKT